MEGLWGFVIIGGPILLGLAILWGVISRFRRKEVPLAETEAATRRNYEREAQERPTTGD